MKLLVCYSTANSSLVSDFRDLIEPKLKVAKGAPVDLWQDVQIPVGEKWRASLRNMLTDVDGALVMLTPELLSSEWALREIAALQKQGKPVLPILLDSVDAQRMDMKGLDRIQYFGLMVRGSRRAFTESPRRKFANAAFAAIHDALF